MNVKRTESKQFPISVVINSEERVFTIEAAKELREKLNTVILEFYALKHAEEVKECQPVRQEGKE